MINRSKFSDSISIILVQVDRPQIWIQIESEIKLNLLSFWLKSRKSQLKRKSFYWSSLRAVPDGVHLVCSIENRYLHSWAAAMCLSLRHGNEILYRVSIDIYYKLETFSSSYEFYFSLNTIKKGASKSSWIFWVLALWFSTLQFFFSQVNCYLQHRVISKNSLSGAIPESITNITGLKKL